MVPKAGSLQTLLTQALHTNDDSLFEYVLSSSMQHTSASTSSHIGNNSNNSIPPVLHATIARLPSTYVIPLLTRLTSLLHSRPSRALPLLTWMQALLLAHTPYLLSQPPHALTAPFSSLMSLLEHRVASFKKMCRLQGKLEVMMAQIAETHQRSHHKRTAVALADALMLEQEEGPRTVYVEGVGQKHSKDSSATNQSAVTAAPASAAINAGKKRRRRRGGG